ncbi:MAG: hypothetical protein F2681_14715 [Actinobacteria bacterium]|jgi:hypothetical protein|nr:hypothetical protein [Actinomycetota bacterium]MSW79218.1 hypothetical protein [Actinomycetota bacterium]MSX54986.1 hypothetical protein [Actinomycetota bacterium]MSX91913.1 hypothetical protein [Actinomycetota bacterium]MSZ84386.1 hypothetical protein [Actinomycetota bacterium]
MEIATELFDALRVRADAGAARLVHPSAGDAAALHVALNAMAESARTAPVAEVELDLPFVWFG